MVAIPNPFKDPRQHEPPKVVGEGSALQSCKKGAEVGFSFWEIFMAFSIVHLDIVKFGLRSSQSQELLDHEKRTPEEIFALIQAGHKFDVRTFYLCFFNFKF